MLLLATLSTNQRRIVSAPTWIVVEKLGGGGARKAESLAATFFSYLCMTTSTVLWAWALCLDLLLLYLMGL